MTNYSAFQKNLQSCRDCASRFGFEPHPVVIGHERSRIMQISQAPSRSAHESLRPFTDASGRRLRNEWYQISDDVFYDPDNFYITAIAHCYPGRAPGGGDRPPPVSCAKKWLLREIQLVDNRLFLLVGGKSAAFFFPDADLTTLVFRDNELHGKPAYVLPHPSPLNIKWFRDHPDFFTTRLPEIRGAVHRALQA